MKDLVILLILGFLLLTYGGFSLVQLGTLMALWAGAILIVSGLIALWRSLK